MFQLIAIIGALAGLAFSVHLCIKWYNMPKVEKQKTEQNQGKYNAQNEKRDDKLERRTRRQEARDKNKE